MSPRDDSHGLMMSARRIGSAPRPPAIPIPPRPLTAGHRWPMTRSRSEEHTSELQSLMRISYAVFCLKKKKQKQKTTDEHKLEIITHTATIKHTSKLSREH